MLEGPAVEVEYSWRYGLQQYEGGFVGEGVVEAELEVDVETGLVEVYAAAPAPHKFRGP